MQKRERMIIFVTTLSISPHKNADWLMQIGEELSENYGVPYLPSDFKKKNGYKRSIELSREYICTGRIFVVADFQRRQRRTCDASETMDFSFLCVIILLPGCATSEEKKTEREIFAMDTIMNLTFYGENGEQAMTAAVSEIQQLEKTLSVTKADSEISKINAACGKKSQFRRKRMICFLLVFNMEMIRMGCLIFQFTRL